MLYLLASFYNTKSDSLVGLRVINVFDDGNIGEFFDEDIFNKDEYVVINSNIETINAYVVDYNEDMDVLVFRFFTMDISFPKYKEDKHWEYLPDYTTIIDKYCNAFVKDYNLISPVRMLFKNFYVGPFMFFNIGNTRQTYTILNNFFGATMPQDEGLFYSSYYIISHLFKYFYERCSLESNIITEEIFNFSLKNIENDIKQEMVDIFLQHCWRDKKYGFVQNVTEGTSVIRVFYLITPPYYDSSSLNNDYNIDDFKVQEIYRFYINHNECFIFRNVCNNWYSVDINKITKDDLYFYLLNNFDENVINNCKLKYFKDILSEAELIYKQDDFNKNSKLQELLEKFYYHY